MPQFAYKKYEQSNLFSNKFGSLSSRFLNLLTFGADLVVNGSAFHAGGTLQLNANFLTFVLLHSTYSTYSAFLVMSDLVGVNKNDQATCGAKPASLAMLVRQTHNIQTANFTSESKTRYSLEFPTADRGPLQD